MPGGAGPKWLGGRPRASVDHARRRGTELAGRGPELAERDPERAAVVQLIALRRGHGPAFPAVDVVADVVGAGHGRVAPGPSGLDELAGQLGPGPAAVLALLAQPGTEFGRHKPKS